MHNCEKVMSSASGDEVADPAGRPSLRIVPETTEPNPTQLGICRRLRADLYDLGLLDIVGPEWIHPDGDGFAVGPLTIRSADQLLRRLDLLVSELRSTGHNNRFGSPSYVAGDPALRHRVLTDGAEPPCEQLRFF